MFTKSRFERASTIPVGFILLIGIAVLGFNVYQLTIVPQAGLDAEVESNRAMLSDVQGFDFAVRGTLTAGTAQPVSIGKPVDYPLAFPPPPDISYVVSTTENESINIANSQCSSGNCQTKINTTNVIFVGDYTYLQQSQVYGYEYGIVYSAPNASTEGSNGIITYSNQYFIQDNLIQLTAFQGNFTYERRGTVHTTLTQKQSASHTYNITDSGSAVNITIPTELAKGRWSSLMKDQLTENGGHISDITYKNYTVIKEGGGNPGNGQANQKHWENCDHSGQGRPFVTCRTDNNSSYVTFTLETGEVYTVESDVIKLSK